MFAISMYSYVFMKRTCFKMHKTHQKKSALPVLSETCLAYFANFLWMQFHVECGGLIYCKVITVYGHPYMPCPTGDRRLCQRSVLLGGIGCLMVGLGFC